MPKVSDWQTEPPQYDGLYVIRLANDEEQTYFALYSLGKWSSGTKHLQVAHNLIPNYPYNNGPYELKWKGVIADDSN